jgi:hypothetical protein
MGTVKIERGPMGELTGGSGPRISFEAFGVPISLQVDSDDALARAARILPPGRCPTADTPESNLFKLFMEDRVSYRVQTPEQSLSGSPDLDVAVEVLDAQLRGFIALRAPDYIFVHAGVVAVEKRAILLPGPTFSGKTTLVAEFLRAGATYYSDEFAVIDREGLVHPYPKPLSIRAGGFSQIDHDAAAFGAPVGTAPATVGGVIMSQYRAGARWRPRQMSSGEGLLAVLSNTIPARDRPEQSLGAIKTALGSTTVLEGERGEAGELVRDVLKLMR